MKKALVVVVVVLLGFGWFSVALDIFGTQVSYSKQIKLAEDSVQKALYEQAVECYNSALSIKPSNEKIYKLIKETYKLFYEEQQNQYSYSLYLDSLEQCCDVYDNDIALWEELIENYYSVQRYDDVYSALQSVKKSKIKSEYINSIEKEIKKIYETSYQTFLSYKLGRNTTYSITDGNSYWITDLFGEEIGITYNFIGPLDSSGRGIYVDNSGGNIRDRKQITRVKIDGKITDSGYFSNGLVPVKINDKWLYLNENGEDAGVGSFDFASSFSDAKAAVMQDEQWKIIDTSGNAVVNDFYDDIALDQYGVFTDGDYFVAKKGENYCIYDMSGSVKAEIDAIEVNIGNFSESIAFKSSVNDLWGFINSSGERVIEPYYINAKGFSNGYAAVSNEDNLWGAINAFDEQIIDYEFYHIGYFTKHNNCIVARTKGAGGILTFKYQ